MGLNEAESIAKQTDLSHADPHQPHQLPLDDPREGPGGPGALPGVPQPGPVGMVGYMASYTIGEALQVIAGAELKPRIAVEPRHSEHSIQAGALWRQNDRGSKRGPTSHPVTLFDDWGNLMMPKSGRDTAILIGGKRPLLCVFEPVRHASTPPRLHRQG